MQVLGLILYGAVWVGNAAVLIYSLNWFYGSGLPHKVLKYVRLVHGLLVFAIPVTLGYLLGPALLGLSALPRRPVGYSILGAYVVICCSAALVYLPWVTLKRLMHRPKALLHNNTETVNVAMALGYKPIGRGKNTQMARLPGNNIFTVDFTEKSIHLPQLPAALDGLSILHLTDLHLHGTPDREFYYHIMDRCRSWDPDVIAYTGDTVDTYHHHRWILPILGRLRFRHAAFAVLGNHDSWYDPMVVRRRLKRLNWTVVGNSWQHHELARTPVTVIGNESPWFRPAPKLDDCPKDTFRLALSHTPDNMQWARRNHVDLLLAGHNHGGQVRFPIIGSVLVPSRYSRRYDGGTYEEPPTVLHVCRGLSGQHPLRYNCRPEVTKIILRARAQSQA
jgi:predicted MPP superfamily phosphohydrolase